MTKGCGFAILVCTVLMGCGNTHKQDCLKHLENVRWDAKEDGLEPIGELQSGNWCMTDPWTDIFRLSDWRDKASRRLCEKHLAPVRQAILYRKDMVLSLMFHKQCFCCIINWFSLVRDARMLRDLAAGNSEEKK